MEEKEREKLIMSLEEFLKDDSFFKVLRGSYLATFTIKKTLSLLLRILIGLIFAIIWTFVSLKSKDYINDQVFLINHFNNISLYFISLVFTGYAIFQGLLGGNTLKTLLIHRDDDCSKLKKYNYQFLIICLYIMVLFFINFCTLFFLRNKFFVDLLKLGDILLIKSVFSFIYISMNLILFSEMIAFFYNLFQIFSLNAIQKGMEFLKKWNNEYWIFNIFQG